jgi:hypothetical protein
MKVPQFACWVAYICLQYIIEHLEFDTFSFRFFSPWCLVYKCNGNTFYSGAAFNFFNLEFESGVWLKIIFEKEMN